MQSKEILKNFWSFLKEDTWQSWIVSIILVIIIIKFIFFPALSFVTGTKLPLVVVESCSMYHESSFDDWWSQNKGWYESRGIEKEDFQSFSLKSGLNKGDIVFVKGSNDYKKGDIIIYTSGTQYPLIHRIVSLNPIQTKGDHNADQITPSSGQNVDETNVKENQILGKAVGKIPALGWIKLVFFEPFRTTGKGFCH